MQISFRRQTDAQLAQGASDRVVRLANPERVEAFGSHQFYTGTRTDNGQDVFVKHNKIDRVIKDGPLMALNPMMVGALERAMPQLDRLQDMTETMFSHFLKGYFGDRHYSGITYQEVLLNDPTTHQPTLAIAAPVVRHLGNLNDLPANQVTNPREAVETTLVRGLLFGDYDVTLHDENTVVIKADGKMSDGTPLRAGEALAMDFGEAGNPGIERFGIPFGNQKLLREFPQDIQPALDHILRLNGLQVHTLVEAAGQHVTGWTPQLTDHYAGVVSDNLDALRQRLAADPHWLDPNQARTWMRQPEQHDLKLYALAIPSIVLDYRRVIHSGILDAIPSNQHVADLLARTLPAYPSEQTSTPWSSPDQ